MSTPRFEVLLRSEHSDGHVGRIEIGVPGPWPGPPLQHHDFDEAETIVVGPQIGGDDAPGGAP